MLDRGDGDYHPISSHNKKWKPHPKNYVKVNFDTSTLGVPNTASMIGVIRN